MKCLEKSLILGMLLFLAGSMLISGCQKYLDAKTNKSSVIPQSLKDVQGLLDYYPTMNYADPGAGEVSADDYYLTDADWAARTETDRRQYLWEKDFLFPVSFNNWSDTYRAIYVANTALQTLEGMAADTKAQPEWRGIRGQALFYRAKHFFQAVLLWGPAFDSATAETDLGIPLRLNINFNEPSVRASMSETYHQVLADLLEAAALLPVHPVHVMRPSKPAADALLARVYLSMGAYGKAGAYADSCLQLYNTLMDYNTLNASATAPVPLFNPEVIFESHMTFPSPLGANRAKIDSVLYRSYSNSDLRKSVFFNNNGNGTFGFKGSYDPGQLFSGVATDEVYLMRGEAAARLGNISGAMTDLNTLLIKRWKTGTFAPLQATDAADALQKILLERRKELLMRGLRWMDLKRLNKEGAGIQLVRQMNGQKYSLFPNDPRYALPIPEDVIALSGLPQNPR